jgi:hypothetical protein
MLAHMFTAGPTACFTAVLGLGQHGKLSTTASFELDAAQLVLLLLLLLLLLLAVLPSMVMLLTVQVPSCKGFNCKQQSSASVSKSITFTKSTYRICCTSHACIEVEITQLRAMLSQRIQGKQITCSCSR